jgi:hypothetical protein
MYKHIKSKLKNMTPRGDDERKTFLGGGGGRGRKPIFLGQQPKIVLEHCKTNVHKKISIQTYKTSQHPKTGKTQGDETTCDDRP